MNVVFDFGAVVFRWQPADFLTRLLPHRVGNATEGAAVAAAFFQSFGGDWAEFDRGSLSPEALIARTADRLGWPRAEVKHVVDAVPDELQPLPDTVTLITRLRAAGHRLFFLSNMPAPYAALLEARNPISDWFEAGIYSSRIGHIKPEPAIFAAAEACFGVKGQDLLFIDDVEKNVVAARRAGWHALQFVGAAQLRTDLIERGALAAL